MMFLGIIDNLIVAWRKRVCYNVRKDFYEKNMTVCTEIFMNESLGRYSISTCLDREPIMIFTESLEHIL